MPDPEEAVLSLNLEVLGIIDFDEGEASIDATLYDSRLAIFVLTGDMAARMGWAAKPTSSSPPGASIPRFHAPPGFPELERLAMSLATGDNPRLRHGDVLRAHLEHAPVRRPARLPRPPRPLRARHSSASMRSSASTR